MQRLLLPLLAFLLAASTLRAEEPRAAWVAGFDGPQKHGDEADRIAVTSDGYAYVVGRANDPRPAHGNAFSLILYRPNGTEVWRRLYAPPGRLAGATGVGAIQVDSRDRVLAVGWGRTAEGQALFVARIDRNGRPDFLLTPPCESSHFGRYPPRLDVDAGDGFAVSATRDDDFLVLRYDVSGSLLWEWTFDGPTPDPDIATDVAIGPSGELVVTGFSGFIHSGYDTFGLAPDGTELWWRNQFGGIGSILGSAFVAVDVAGDVVVSATPEAWCGLPHAQTWKYSSDGVEVWSDLSDTCRSVSVQDMALDGEGNVLVLSTAYIDHLRNYDLQLMKYSPGGILLWRHSFDGPAGTSDHASALAVDGDNAVYVVGGVQSVVGEHDIVTLKYQPDGTREWTRIYDGGHLDSARDVTVSSAGEVLLTGHRYHTPGESADFVTLAYQQNGCAADVTGDGVVNRDDADRLKAAAGPCLGLCSEDLNGDRVVDDVDGEILRGSVGPCP